MKVLYVKMPKEYPTYHQISFSQFTHQPKKKKLPAMTGGGKKG